MRLNFTQQELSYAAQKLGYNDLVGLDMVPFDESDCKRALIEKGYLVVGEDKCDFSNEINILFLAWAKTQYTVARTRFLGEDHSFVLLASDRYIISYSFHEGEIQISLCDFSSKVMDSVFVDYFDLDATENEGKGFNLSLRAEEFFSIFTEDFSMERACKKTGLSEADLSSIITLLEREDTDSFILQNLKDDVGCLGIIAKLDDGYMMLKDIVYNRDGERKIVVLKGAVDEVVDSIYII